MTTGLIERPTESPPRKPSAAKSWLKAIELTSRIEAEPSRLFADVVENWAARQPDRAGADVGYRDVQLIAALAERINRYARWALSAGIKPGDTVCLFMPSRPDYVAAWLGITKVGGVVALINTKLVGPSLSHCINVARRRSHHPRRGIGAMCSRPRVPHLNRAPKIWIHGGHGMSADHRCGACSASMDGAADAGRTARRHASTTARC